MAAAGGVLGGACGAWWLPEVTNHGPRYPLNATREQKIAIIKRTLVSELGTWQIKRRLKEELSALASSGGGASRPGGAGDVLSEIERILGSTGLGVELKNLIYGINRQALVSPPAAPEGLTEEETYCADRIAYVEEAKLQWEKRIRRELDVMAAELGVPLHRYKGRDPPRPQHDNQAFRFVYDDNDFLDILSNISSASNAPIGVHIPRWGMIHVELSTRDMAGLRSFFAELDPRIHCLSVDDDVKPQFADEHAKRLQAAVDIGFIPGIRQAAKTGIPQRLRPRLWQRMLGVAENCEEADRAYFDRLADAIKEVELVTDDLIRYDVAGVSDYNDFFVFEDQLSECMGAFSRDTWVCANATTQSQANDRPFSESERISMVYPPCGIVPFQGMVMYAAPLCYVWSDTRRMYFNMRAMYAQYFCRLFTISTREWDILHLSRQFEDTLQEACPELVFHLCDIGMPPLKIAFNWIFYGFAGYLEVDQVLAVWDRVLAWDSLLVLPVVAAAIFSFRERSMLECSTPDEVKEVLEDTVRLKVMPMLHLFLFGDVLEARDKARKEGA